MLTSGRKVKLRSRVKRCWQLYLILLLPLCSSLLFSYQPMYGLQIAFRNYNPAKGVSGSEWVGLSHIVKFVTSYNFLNVLTNTLRLSLLGLLSGPPLAIVFALMLNTVRSIRLKKTLQTVTYMPYFISTVVFVGMLQMFFSPAAGIYGGLHRLLNEGQFPQAIIGKLDTFVPSYILSAIWQSLGWSSIIYLAALSNVSMELHEAAIVDGASRLRRVFAVDIPAITPVITINVILACGGIMSVGFEKSYLMQTALNLPVSEVISTYVYKVGLRAGMTGFSYGAAIGFFNNIINFLMLFSVNMLARKFSPDKVSFF